MSKQITTKDRQVLAQEAGVNEQYLYQCLTGRRDMNPAEAVRIEGVSNGLVTRYDLCQKTGESIWPKLPIPTPPAEAA